MIVNSERLKFTNEDLVESLIWSSGTLVDCYEKIRASSVGADKAQNELLSLVLDVVSATTCLRSFLFPLRSDDDGGDDGVGRDPSDGPFIVQESQELDELFEAP